MSGFDKVIGDYHPEARRGATEMLDSIRASLKSRAQGIEGGGDLVIMHLVDEIVLREAKEPGWWGRFASRLHKAKRKAEDELREQQDANDCYVRENAGLRDNMSRMEAELKGQIQILRNALVSAAPCTCRYMGDGDTFQCNRCIALEETHVSS